MAIKKIHYHKLIRDRIPDVMRTNHARFKISTLNRKRFIKELLKKVGEEASALPALSKKSDITSELADTLDVIKAIQQTLKISDREVLTAQKTALKKKGWFNKRIFLSWAEDTGYRTNERRNSNDARRGRT